MKSFGDGSLGKEPDSGRLGKGFGVQDDNLKQKEITVTSPVCNKLMWNFPFQLVFLKEAYFYFKFVFFFTLSTPVVLDDGSLVAKLSYC